MMLFGDFFLDNLSIGDTVRVEGLAETLYTELPSDNIDIVHVPKGKGKNAKVLMRYPRSARECVFIGWTYLATGWYGWGDEEEPSHLMEDKRHRVAVVVQKKRAGVFQRYVKPYHSLPEDLHAHRSN